MGQILVGLLLVAAGIFAYWNGRDLPEAVPGGMALPVAWLITLVGGPA